jgi:hypothetical protein
MGSPLRWGAQSGIFASGTFFPRSTRLRLSFGTIQFSETLMMRACVRVGVFSLLLALSSFWPTPCQAQQTVTLPPNWQQMSPTDFAAAIRPLSEAETFKQLSASDQAAATAYGTKLFLQTNLTTTTLSYQTLEMLAWLARYQIDEAALESAQKALLARQDNWTGQPYAEIRAKVVMMMRLKVPDEAQIAEARRWVQAGGTYAQIPKADLDFDIVRETFADVQVVPGSLSVQWKGQLNAPQTGNYVFSISPININSADNKYPVQFAVSVSVGGKLVLNATPNQWVTQSNAVNLTANQPVPLQMTVSANVRRMPSGTMHAMLYWQGPGINPSVIPPANLTLPDGSGQGVQGTYTWTTNGQPQSLTRNDPTIDFSWTSAPILLSEDMQVANQASTTLWETTTASNFITTSLGPPVQLHPFLKNPDDSSAALTSAQRQTFLGLIVQNPNLLSAVDSKTISNFYQSFRMGAPDQALSVFTLWASQQANLASGFSTDPVFEGDARDAFRKMALYTTLELPTQWTQLQSGSLQMPDGSCCLPVAYTLAVSSLGRGKLADWTASLDTRLSDAALTGDLRVNWLLARSFAEEIRLSAPSLYLPLTSRALAGRSFLDQANQAAQSPAVKVRVLNEISARLVWGQQYSAAQTLLQQASNSLPSAQQAVLANWEREIGTLAAAAAQAQQNQAAGAQQAYLNTLKQRRDQATAQGNTALVNRYNTLINAATNQ